MEFMALRVGVPAYMETSDGKNVEFTLPRGMVLRQEYTTKSIKGTTCLKVLASASLGELMNGNYRKCYVTPCVKRNAVDIDALVKGYVHDTEKAEQNYRRRKDSEIRISVTITAAIALLAIAMFLIFVGVGGVGCALLVISGLVIWAFAFFEEAYRSKIPNAEAQVAEKEEVARRRYSDAVKAMIS